MIIIVLAVIIAGVAIVGGGNTLTGFGHDAENTGAKIQKATE